MRMHGAACMPHAWWLHVLPGRSITLAFSTIFSYATHFIVASNLLQLVLGASSSPFSACSRMQWRPGRTRLL